MSIQFSSSYDVAVIGGGPAGSTVATLLQRQGHRCLILESTSFPRYHIGESLIPHTYGTFDRLGLLSKMKQSQFPVKHSVRFVAPSGKEAAPFYFHETIERERAKTWQVKRSEFDVLCQNNAREAGVEIRSATKVSKVHFDGSQAVGLRIETVGREAEDIQAKVIVDASGRATVLGKQLDLKTDIPGLNKSAIWTYYRGAYRREGIDAGETTVFMIPERGWFWYIPLPDDIVSVGIVASSEYLFRNSNHYDDVFPVEVGLCQPLSEWLTGAEAINPLRGIRKLAYINKQVEISGTAEKVSTIESLKYFATRPRGSQLGAWVSEQSSIITSRSLLDAKLAEVKHKFANNEIPWPSFWGGYRVVPQRVEFWQGQPNRLHDRFEYSLQADASWIRQRLAP